MTAQTRNEYLLERIAERLGVPKPAGGQVFSPEPADARSDLLAILADPAAAKQRLDELAEQTATARKAIAEAKAARAERDAAIEAIAGAQATHEQKLADAKFNHEREMEHRTRNAGAREAAVAAREKEADEQLAQANKLKAEYGRKLAEFHRLAAA